VAGFYSATQPQYAAAPIRVTNGRASRNSGDSLRLQGAETNGAITWQFRPQKATTLSPFTFLCPLKPMCFLRRGCRSVAADDGGVEKIGLMQLQHRAGKHGLETAIRLPLSKYTINARVMNFRAAFLIFLDRQLFQLTPKVKRL
jgi:hypothetical protein